MTSTSITLLWILNEANTEQKMKFFNKDFISKCGQM